MFTKVQYNVPADFVMWSVRRVDAYCTKHGHATVEAWDTPEGRLFYALGEDDELIAPAGLNKAAAVMEARRHVRWRDHVREQRGAPLPWPSH